MEAVSTKSEAASWGPKPHDLEMALVAFVYIEGLCIELVLFVVGKVIALWKFGEWGEERLGTVSPQPLQYLQKIHSQLDTSPEIVIWAISMKNESCPLTAYTAKQRFDCTYRW